MKPPHQRRERPDIWAQVEDDLNTNLSKADAWQMAQNLGIYVDKNCGNISPQKFIRATFSSAFGEDCMAPRMKNRKRYLVLPSETKGRSAEYLNNNEIAKSGGEFKQIAKALEPIRRDYIALLVKDTSFEPEYSRGKVSDEAGFELIQIICNNIVEKHDLVEYFKALAEYKIAPSFVDETTASPEELKRSIPRLFLEDLGFTVPPKYEDGKFPEDKTFLYKGRSKEYKVRTKFSFSKTPSMYADTKTILMNTYYDEEPERLTHLAPTICLGDIYLPTPIFKVKLPDKLASKFWAEAGKDASGKYEEAFAKQFGHLPFFNKECDSYCDLHEGLVIYDFEFKNKNRKSEFSNWERLINKQEGEHKIGFAIGYSCHRVCLMLLPNADGTQVLPHITISGTHSGVLLGDFPKEYKWDSYNDDGRSICLTDSGKTCFFETTNTDWLENKFSKLASLLSTGFEVDTNTGKGFLSHTCDKYAAWHQEVGLNNLYDNYSPIFYPNFDYEDDLFIKTPKNTIIGKIHLHGLSVKPEDSIFAELANEAKAFKENLNAFMKKPLQENADKEANLRAYFKK